MADIKLEIPGPLREFFAEAIRGAGGNEVFFLARVSFPAPDLARVEEADVAARGNRSAAPAIIERAGDWDLAIHNHPSGNLEPSPADLEVAGILGNRGVGFAIIDNLAERHYLTIPPFPREADPGPLDLEDVAAVFAPRGPIARQLGDYEVRAAQVAMAREVARALEGDAVVAVEAGTGVGKSFAYLVPAILWSLRHKKRVIVSTNTINLQEQLIGKDLPFLERALPVKFRYALIKGRGNYACRRKVLEARSDLASTLVDTDEGARQLRALVEWAATSSEGSRSELGAPPAEAIWEKVMSETDKSLKVKCPHYQECFYYRAKRQAGKVDIVVVNHSLYFADLAVRRETGNYNADLVIPAYERVIFDEAHHLEDVASEHLGVRFTQAGVRTRLSRLLSPKDPRKGVLPFLSLRLRKEGALGAAEAVEQGLLAELPLLTARIEEHLALCQGLVEAAAAASPGRPGAGGLVEESGAAGPKVRITADPSQTDFRDRLRDELRGVSECLGLLLAQTKRAVGALETDPGLDDDRRAPLLLELTSLRDRLVAFLGDIAFFLDFSEKTQARWVEIRGRRGDRTRSSVLFAASPIRVADELRSSIYDPLKTVVLTSATLSVGGKIEYLGDRLGFASLDKERFRYSEHPSPFDYGKQAVALVPDDFPEPGAAGFELDLQRVILEILRRSRGRAFVLFTAYGLLRRMFEALERPLRALGIEPLRQGDGGRSELLARFRSGPSHALFGTDSFWEGVDVKGEALSCVVITRLPFRVPTEPIQLARVEDLEARGQNPFTAFTVPQAVLKLKQGFGRLIRSASDRGAVVILDRRIVTKRYGETFLRSLPPARFVRGPTARVLAELERFFGEEKKELTIGAVAEPPGAPIPTGQNEPR